MQIAQLQATEFWRSMPQFEREAVITLINAGWIVHPTGSRMICPAYCREDSDWDLMLLSDEDWEGIDTTVLFPEHVSKYIDYNDNEVDEGVLRIGSLNLCYLEAWVYQAWKEATEFLINIPNATSRDTRIKMFKMFTSYECDRHIAREKAQKPNNQLLT